MSDAPVTITDASFLAMFVEFNDASTYPAPLRNLLLTTALATLDPIRWGDWYELGIYLWVAHHLALFGNQNNRRQSPGRPPLLQTSKSVGGVSASYNTAAVTLTDGGLWNATSYGIRWLELAKLAGMGGVQLTGGPVPAGVGGLGYTGPIDYGGHW